jgi:hypothetical protein
MRTKKVKPPPKKFEYILKISKKHDRYEKKDYISFRFHTTKEFLTFKYILNIETELKDNCIIFNIIGFKAPIDDLSKFGQAEYEYRFFDFKQTEYAVVVHRKDVDKSKFKVFISRSKSEPVKVRGVSKNSFIDVITSK